MVTATRLLLHLHTHTSINTTPCGDTVPYLQQYSQARLFHMLRRGAIRIRTSHGTRCRPCAPRDTAVIRREDKIRGAVPYSNTTAVAVASAAGDHRRGSRGRRFSFSPRPTRSRVRCNVFAPDQKLFNFPPSMGSDTVLVLYTARIVYSLYCIDAFIERGK